MGKFDTIIQEINTNIADNNTQSITAKKLRDTLIDLTDTIVDVQDSFESDIDTEVSELGEEIRFYETNINNRVNGFETSVNNEIDRFETSVNGQIDDMNEEITGFETSINDQISDINDDIDDIREDITTYHQNDYEASYAGKIVGSDGSLVNATTAQALTKEYDIQQDVDYYANLFTPSTSSTSWPIAYYNGNTFISGEHPVYGSGGSGPISRYKLTVPGNATKVRVFGNITMEANLYNATSISDEIENINNEIAEIKEDITLYHQNTYSEDYINKIPGADGSLIDASTSGALTKEYVIQQGLEYYANLWTPSSSSTNWPIAYYDGDTFIIGERPRYGSGSAGPILNYELTVPSNATKVRIFGNINVEADLYNKISIKDEIENINDEINEINDKLKANYYEDVVNIYTKKALGPDGSLIDNTASGAVVKEYIIQQGLEYYANFYSPGIVSNLGVAYYDANDTFISGEHPSPYSRVVTQYKLTIPNNTNKVRLFGINQIDPNLYNKEWLSDYIYRITDEINEINDKLKNNYYEDAIATYNKMIPDINGELVATTSSGSKTNEYTIEQGIDYFADLWSPTESSNRLPIAYYDDNDTFISGEHPSPKYSMILNYRLNIPNEATKVRIFGRGMVEPRLYTIDDLKNIVDKLENEIEELKNSENNYLSLDFKNQIYETPIIRRDINHTLKILCFGSSWFMDTWWYLNKIINSAGINAEIHSYYMGHSEFKEWINLYDNDLSPFEETRTASKCISINGANWTITTKGSIYTPQQYRDDWYNDLTGGGWDLIVFQQGARQAPYWDKSWGDYWSRIVEIVKSNCDIDTVIGFNSTWTPAVQDVTEMRPWPATVEGQMGWQRANWENTNKFMNLSGIYNVIPNGKCMWLLRRSSLNTSNDLADDGLHPNNGLPIYALGGCFYETYIAPMYGISFNNVDWLPDSSTQKASVSGSSFTPITTDDVPIVRDIIKKSRANRFDF